MLTDVLAGGNSLEVADAVLLQFRTLAEEASLKEEINVSVADEPTTAMLTEHIRDEARSEALLEARQEWEKKESELRSRIARALDAFAQERKRYFAGIEQQVVKLSLAIAEKVLHREATIDPLLLTGAVRVALDSVAGRSPAVLRVAAEEAQVWQKHLEPSADAPELQIDETMRQGECVLETKVGSVDLSIRSQLAEIETSLFDLLGRRPMAEA